MRGVSVVNTTEQYLKELSNDIKLCNSKISEFDTLLSELYHDLETRNINAYEGWKIAKEMQLVLQQRRAWKQRKIETQESFNELGGYKLLNKLKNKRQRRVNKFMKRNSWYDNFSKEAIAILEGTAT
ncbi:hypothetical protein [Staphylococcus chromogenes]|uniref:hypothetical protein n=1 Tax=Staphylococcus chromogenes TaxID=46126 RepID=UPI0028885A78|nr:hypothetical protein [Staphylococcus chromogenes]MDT0700349.1 hypothetical protein [Staphylococcus chromogenes]